MEWKIKQGPNFDFSKCEDEGTLHLTRFPDGTYWLRVEDCRNASNGLDTLFKYEGRKAILVELLK